MAQEWAAAFYNSKEWKALRLRRIVEERYTCQECGENYMLRPAELIGHHSIELTPKNIIDKNVSLNPGLIKVICKKCHDKIHKRFGFNGSHAVFLVYGAPCSGKTTWVNQMAERGDLIVDVNEIYRAISGCEIYDKPDNLKRAALGVRDLLVEQVRMRSGHWSNAYVVGGYPRKLQREQLASTLGAALIFIDVTEAEAAARATASRGTMGNQWEKFIRRWFQDFQP